MEWLSRPWASRPHQLRQPQGGGRDRSRQVEAVVRGRGVLEAEQNAASQITAIRIVARLAPVAENVQRVLALQDLLYEVRDNMRHRESNVAAHDLGVAQGPLFSNANAVEWTRNSVGKFVLLVRTLHKEFCSQLLKSVSRSRRRAATLCAFRCRELVGALEDHARRDDRDLL